MKKLLLLCCMFLFISDVSALDLGNTIINQNIKNVNNSNAKIKVYKGDMNFDGVHDDDDSQIILNYSVSIGTLTDIQKIVGECNGDGYIDSEDSLRIMQYQSGKKEKEYIELDLSLSEIKDYIVINESLNDEGLYVPYLLDSELQKITTTYEGLYHTFDDYGGSYYFRGAVDNNWVKFAGFYWRIIRVNGDNSVRLIYSGEVAPTESEKVQMTGDKTSIGSSSFSVENNTSEDVGFMYTIGEQYGNSNNSVIKQNLDNWYKQYLTSYSSYIVDNHFCSDRSAYEDDLVTSASGIGKNEQYFGGMVRTDNNTATLKCLNVKDAYSVNESSNGNGVLDYPVGLLTMDEAYYAGLKYGIFQTATISNYLHTNNIQWLMTPLKFDGNITSYNFAILFDGYVYWGNNYSDADVRPVISVDFKDGEFQGDGTYNNPYVLKTELENDLKKDDEVVTPEEPKVDVDVETEVETENELNNPSTGVQISLIFIALLLVVIIPILMIKDRIKKI